MNVQLDPWQQEALNGELGVRTQAEVIAELEDEGYVVEFEEDQPEADPQQEWTQAMLAEMGRLERHIGRPITKKEFEGITSGLSLNRGATDLVAEHGERLKHRGSLKDSKDEQEALMVEEIEDARAREAEQEAQGEPEPEPEEVGAE